MKQRLPITSVAPVADIVDKAAYEINIIDLRALLRLDLNTDSGMNEVRGIGAAMLTDKGKERLFYLVF